MSLEQQGPELRRNILTIEAATAQACKRRAQESAYDLHRRRRRDLPPSSPKARLPLYCSLVDDRSRRGLCHSGARLGTDIERRAHEVD